MPSPHRLFKNSSSGIGLQQVQLCTGKGRPFSSLFPVKRGKIQLLEYDSSTGKGRSFPSLFPVKRGKIQLLEYDSSTGKGRPFSSLFPVKTEINSASGKGFQHVKLRPRMIFEQRENIQLLENDSSTSGSALEWILYRGKNFQRPIMDSVQREKFSFWNRTQACSVSP